MPPSNFWRVLAVLCFSTVSITTNPRPNYYKNTTPAPPGGNICRNTKIRLESVGRAMRPISFAAGILVSLYLPTSQPESTTRRHDHVAIYVGIRQKNAHSRAGEPPDALLAGAQRLYVFFCDCIVLLNPYPNQRKQRGAGMTAWQYFL